jgi:hypothetical protein
MFLSAHGLKHKQLVCHLIANKQKMGAVEETAPFQKKKLLTKILT